MLVQQVIELFLICNTDVVSVYMEYQSTGFQFSYSVAIMLLQISSEKQTFVGIGRAK